MCPLSLTNTPCIFRLICKAPNTPFIRPHACISHLARPSRVTLISSCVLLALHQSKPSFKKEYTRCLGCFFSGFLTCLYVKEYTTSPLYIYMYTPPHLPHPPAITYLRTSYTPSPMATSNTLKLTALATLLAILASTLAADAYFCGARDDFDGDENMSMRCRREVQQCRMEPCKNFMKSMVGGGGGETFGRGVLAMSATTNQMSMKEMCCRELRAVSERCRCEAVKEMMREMREEEGEGGEGGGFGGGGACMGMMEEMMRKAERLPSMCGMRPEYCCIRGGG